MFKITCFAEITPEKLGAALRGFRFQKVKEGFEWKVENYTFRIEPFGRQPSSSLKGYRVLFDGNIDGGIYIFDMAIGWLDPQITGIEYTLTHTSRTTIDWVNDLMKRNSFKTVDTKGIFKKGRVGVVAVNNEVTLQIRARSGKTLKLIDCIKEVESVREEITPVDFDLFSVMEVAV